LRTTEYDLTPSLCDHEIPTLLFHGDEDLVPVDVVRPIADALRAAQLVVLPACGHFALLEQPDRTIELIESFVGSHSAHAWPRRCPVPTARRSPLVGPPHIVRCGLTPMGTWT
jgi:hypothetical protein